MTMDDLTSNYFNKFLDPIENEVCENDPIERHIWEYWGNLTSLNELANNLLEPSKEVYIIRESNTTQSFGLHAGLGLQAG